MRKKRSRQALSQVRFLHSSQLLQRGYVGLQLSLLTTLTLKYLVRSHLVPIADVVDEHRVAEQSRHYDVHRNYVAQKTIHQLLTSSGDRNLVKIILLHYGR